MKKRILFAAFAACLLAGCDNDDLEKRVDSLENRLEIVEKTLTEINSGISSLRSIVEALQNGKSVSNVEETATGYVITFSDGSNITLKHTDRMEQTDRTQLPRLSVWMNLKELITGPLPSTVKPNSWKTTERKFPLQVIPRKWAWMKTDFLDGRYRKRTGTGER